MAFSPRRGGNKLARNSDICSYLLKPVSTLGSCDGESFPGDEDSLLKMYMSLSPGGEIMATSFTWPCDDLLVFLAAVHGSRSSVSILCVC
mmetsp:Transcript_18538/g.27538  ORF Transcript_18538/g.27538 Transcript_18538/m.27538 type:complete len:90 (-) Transcript_18538:77-346(-)